MLSSDEPFDDRLARWLARARTDDAVAERQREGWLRRQDADALSWHGALADLAERRLPVVIVTTGGNHHAGVIAALGHDVVATTLDGGGTRLLRIDAIDTVLVRDRHPPSGARTLVTSFAFADVVADLAADRAEVVLVTTSGPRVRGRIDAVGADAVRVRVGDGHAAAYVPLAAIVEIGEA